VLTAAEDLPAQGTLAAHLPGPLGEDFQRKRRERRTGRLETPSDPKPASCTTAGMPVPVAAKGGILLVAIIYSGGSGVVAAAGGWRSWLRTGLSCPLGGLLAARRGGAVAVQIMLARP
jgi:hypothetical protein